MSFLEEYPQIKIIQQIAQKKKVKVYLVGGFLRDHFLNNERTDFDFAVSSGALLLARGFSKKIRGAFVLLDKERGCARVCKKTGGKIFTFDFTDFRAKTLKGDVSKRDFTINTLCMDLETGQLLDLNKGRADIKAKKIKMVSASAFKEDPLRLLRAFSLRAQLGFVIEKKTQIQMKKDIKLLTDVSRERVREELFKVLATDRTSQCIKEMDKIGLLEQVIPQINVMYNVKQGGYHHLDVWKHTLETVVQLEKVFEELGGSSDIASYLNEPMAGDRKRFALIKLAAILHDIGKPDTYKKEKGKMSFHGHEHVGKKISRSISNMLKLSINERHALEDMIQWHLRPGYLSNFKVPGERAIFRYFRDTKQEAVSIALLALADQRATRGPMTTKWDQKHHEKIAMSLIDKYFAKLYEKPFVRLINGNDLIKKLKLKPSPVFAKVLSEVEESQVLGKIKTKKEALELAGKIVKGRA